MSFGGYLNETWHAFIVYMLRRRPEVLHSVGNNALISGLGKGPIGIVLLSHVIPDHATKGWIYVHSNMLTNHHPYIIEGFECSLPCNMHAECGRDIWLFSGGHAIADQYQIAGGFLGGISKPHMSS